MSRNRSTNPREVFLTIRVSRDMATLIDRAVAKESARLGVIVTRSQFVRGLLYKAAGLSPSGDSK